MKEGIQLPEFEGLWEEAPLPLDMVKALSEYVGSTQLVLYRQVPYGPVPTLMVGDRVEFKSTAEHSVLGCDCTGFVVEERPDFEALVAHGRGNTTVISKDAIQRVQRKGQEIWRREGAY